MACDCRDKEGNLLSMCVGACVKKVLIQQEEQVKRDPMQGFAELILSQVEQRIRNQMNSLRVSFEKEKLELYKSAFLEGIKEGLRLAREVNRNDDY